MKLFHFTLLAAALAGSNALAQGPGAGGNPFAVQPGLSDSTGPGGGAGAPVEKKRPGGQLGEGGPTTIDSQAMDYDEKTRVAIFTGEDYGVFLKDPQFTMNCDKLTAYMRKPGAAGAAGVAGPAGKGGAKPTGAAALPGPGKGGLERAVAEGTPDRPVVIVQEKPATNGEEAQHNVGIAQKADYNAETGDVILTGWPRVSQGVDTQIATSRETVMIMNKDGRTMKTHGPSHSVLQEQEAPKKTVEPSPTPLQ